ncbi:MAG: hypothetical protein GX864_02820 [Mollicutes bacterium]|jgi:predicted PurR-regulated permease PerM|nr:hypothetical protein [Mollicutes bacterium]
MNNKGQTLVIFVILIPIFILILALVVDNGLIMNAKNKIINTSEIIIKNVYHKLDENNHESLIKELYDKNEIKYTNLITNYEDNKLTIKIKSAVKSIFGKVVGMDKYKFEISLTATIENAKIIIEKG